VLSRRSGAEVRLDGIAWLAIVLLLRPRFTITPGSGASNT